MYMIIYRMVLLKALVFTDTKKSKSKAKLRASNSRQRKVYGYQLDKQVYKQQGVQICRHQQDRQVYYNSQDIQINKHQ